MQRLSAIFAMLIFLVVFTGTGLTAERPGRSKGRGAGGQQMETMMNGMQGIPDLHQRLARNYRKNFIAFARTLKVEIARSNSVDRDFALETVDEMRRSIEQMQKHHDEHVKALPRDMRRQMSDMLKTMDDRFATIKQHLDYLEQEAKADNPDPQRVLTELNQILEQNAMMRMRPGTHNS